MSWRAYLQFHYFLRMIFNVTVLLNLFLKRLNQSKELRSHHNIIIPTLKTCCFHNWKQKNSCFPLLTMFVHLVMRLRSVRLVKLLFLLVSPLSLDGQPFRHGHHLWFFLWQRDQYVASCLVFRGVVLLVYRTCRYLLTEQSKLFVLTWAFVVWFPSFSVFLTIMAIRIYWLLWNLESEFFLQRRINLGVRVFISLPFQYGGRFVSLYRSHG